MNQRINVMIIPTNFCNMDCVYCFHNSHNKNAQRMSLETLDKIMSVIIPSYEQITFIWHGGEPLSMGINFYKKVLEYEKKYSNSTKKIENLMQSNLTLLNDEFAEFLVKNNFKLGSSFDGTENEKTRGYSAKILAGRKLLEKYGSGCGFIQVVSNENVNTLIESYEFFKREKINYSLNMYIADSQNVDKLALDIDEYIKKVKDLFDYWFFDKDSDVRITLFREIIGFILFNKKSICTYCSCVGHWLAVRPQGEIYPCNRFFPEKYEMGNIWNYHKAEEIFESKGFENLLSDAVKRREKCQKCEIYKFCEGGCNNNALNENGIQYNGGNSCKSLIQIYAYIFEKINKALSGEFQLSEINSWVREQINKYSIND